MWWSMATISTVGYGDMAHGFNWERCQRIMQSGEVIEVPETAAGKVVGGDRHSGNFCTPGKLTTGLIVLLLLFLTELAAC